MRMLRGNDITNFEKLMELNKKFSEDNEWGGVLNIRINDNRTCYTSIRESLISNILSGNPDEDAYANISQEDLDCIEECENIGTMVEINWFNFTPCGHYSIFDSTVEGAALKLLKCVENVLEN